MRPLGAPHRRAALGHSASALLRAAVLLASVSSTASYASYFLQNSRCSRSLTAGSIIMGRSASQSSSTTQWTVTNGGAVPGTLPLPPSYPPRSSM